MNKLLDKNKINKKIIDEIAKIIADFHSKIDSKSEASKLHTQTKIDPIVEINWKENFEQTRPFIGKTISKPEFYLIKDKIEDFIRTNMELFRKRLVNGKVKYCHGDIHSGNIFIADRIYIFDAIEFNDRIRYSDVTADVGFLAMDLEFKNRPILANFLIDRYCKFSEDKELKKLLSFYKCYRAYVRGKVVSFNLNDFNIDDKEKERSKKEAKAYFKLARKYVESFS